MAEKTSLKSLKVWLDADLHATIKEMAARDRRTMSAFIVHLVEREIEARKRAAEQHDKIKRK
jgi:cytidylate kinase